MASLLMDALTTSTATLSPGTPGVISSPGPNISPALGAPQLEESSLPTSIEIPPEPPQAQEMETVEENGDDFDDFEDDPVCQIMDILNFTVLPRKPTNILATPLPPGDLMPKSQYVEEKRALFEMIKAQKKELMRAQADKLTESMKLMAAEKKMHKVVKIIAELHNLYGKFVKSLALLMAKSEGKDGQILLTIGPFPDVQEVDKLLIMLCSLSNQFETDFENLSGTKRSLKEVNDFLDEKVISKSSQNSNESQDLEIVEEVEVIGGNVERSVSVEGSFCSETPTLVIPEDECGSFENAAIDHNWSASGAGSTIESQNSVPPPVAEENEEASVFVPMPLSNSSLQNGKTMYSLVEYPKQLNLLNKKHGFDSSKNGLGYYCLCGQSFESMALIKYHVRYFSAKWKFLCKLCSRKYPGLNFLKLHMLRTHKIMYVGTNGCNYCPKNFQTASELLTHLKTVHQKKLPSEVDHLTTTSAAATQSLVNLSSGPESGATSSTSNAGSTSSSVLVVNGSRCACGVDAGSRDGLIAHIRSEVEAHGQHFTCSECQEIFNHPCNLKSHFREKHGVEYQDYQERQYGCSSCDAMFGSYEELDSHLNSEHNMDQDIQDQDPLSINDAVENMMSGSGSDDNTITFHVQTDTNCLNRDEGLLAPSEPTIITIDDDD